MIDILNSRQIGPAQIEYLPVIQRMLAHLPPEMAIPLSQIGALSPAKSTLVFGERVNVSSQILTSLGPLSTPSLAHPKAANATNAELKVSDLPPSAKSSVSVVDDTASSSQLESDSKNILINGQINSLSGSSKKNTFRKVSLSRPMPLHLSSGSGSVYRCKILPAVKKTSQTKSEDSRKETIEGEGANGSYDRQDLDATDPSQNVHLSLAMSPSVPSLKTNTEDADPGVGADFNSDVNSVSAILESSLLLPVSSLVPAPPVLSSQERGRSLFVGLINQGEKRISVSDNPVTVIRKNYQREMRHQISRNTGNLRIGMSDSGDEHSTGSCNDSLYDPIDLDMILTDSPDSTPIREGVDLQQAEWLNIVIKQDNNLGNNAMTFTVKNGVGKESKTINQTKRNVSDNFEGIEVVGSLGEGEGDMSILTRRATPEVQVFSS